MVKLNQPTMITPSLGTSPKLRLARAASLALGLLTLALTLTGAFFYFESLVNDCFVTSCELGLLDAPNRLEIEAIGLSVPVYSALILLIELVYVAVHFAVAALLFVRAPNNGVALLGAVFLVAWGGTFGNIASSLSDAYPAYDILVTLVGWVGVTALFAFFSIFPSGHFVPRHMRTILIAWAVVGLVIQLGDDDAPITDNLLLLCGTVFSFFGFLASLVFAQTYRYFRVSSPTQRQQTRWVVFGLAIALTGLSVLMMVAAFFDPLPEPRALTSLLFHAVFHAVNLFIPLSLLAAILQSRLWSIDIIIRRTLIYAALTGALAGFYLLSVFLLQGLLQLLTGETRGELVTVVSTLAIAALFFPVRAYVQEQIDRRFYRRKYDAIKTVAAFGATLRDEVDLGDLLDHLLEVVDETMQPLHVSLWLPQDRTAVPYSFEEMDRR